MFSPRAISWRIAGMPAGVAGTFTIRLGRSTAFHSRSASVDCGLGIIGQIGRAFQADVTVAAFRSLIDAAQHIGGGADVGDGQMLVDFRNAVVGLRPEIA